MKTTAITAAVLFALALASALPSPAGEEPLVKKVACDACGADGAIPTSDSHIGSMLLNERRIATPYCRKCSGAGSLLVLPSGQKMSAATPEQVKAYNARIKVLELSATIKSAEDHLARMKAELKAAQDELAAQEKQSTEKAQTRR